MITWTDGPWHLHDMEIGGTVYLVDAGASQRIVWQTRVTHWFAVPYEGIGDLAMEVFTRWGLFIETPEMSPGGFCIGWRAEPVVRLNRGPQPLPDHIAVGESEILDLDGFQQSEHMSKAFHQRWGLPPTVESYCTGRSPIGWFGPPK